MLLFFVFYQDKIYFLLSHFDIIRFPVWDFDIFFSMSLLLWNSIICKSCPRQTLQGSIVNADILKVKATDFLDSFLIHNLSSCRVKIGLVVSSYTLRQKAS